MENTNCTSCGTEDENPLNVSNCPPETSDVVTTPACDFWELVNSPEACIMGGYIDESLSIGGANLNVHKLLGIHEQDLLQDVTGLGEPISGGAHPSFPATNAFDTFITEWHSVQTGVQVATSAYIGYDFGPIRLNNGRLRYGIDTFIKHDIASLRIKQGCEPENRATKVRVERSPDGVKWYGVAIVDLQDCDGLITVNFKKTVPSRYWRLRPVAFNGGTNDYWVIQALQLMEYEATSISNIQDKIFMENRDRDYNEFAIRMKCSYSPQDVVANQMKFGFMGDEQYILEVSFAQAVAKLGRPFVIGDIVQLPSENQYTPSLKSVPKYLEVMDVGWSVNGFTPTWVPTMQRLIAKPAYASQETQDVLGKLTARVDSSGLFDNKDGNAPKYQDNSDITQSIKAAANTAVPQDGTDYANIPVLSEDLINYGKDKNLDLTKLSRRRHPHGIDAMPPNGLPYTQADEFPATPKDRDYHRLTFDAVGTGIPARLYRYSKAKNEWIFLESDHRYRLRNTRSRLEEFKNGSYNGIPVAADNVDDELAKDV